MTPTTHDTNGEWQPEYRVAETGAGANVNYDCPCGCDAGFAFDRSVAEQDRNSCCCGRLILVGPDAEQRLLASLDDASAYSMDVRDVPMPWGQPAQVALAIPGD